MTHLSDDQDRRPTGASKGARVPPTLRLGLGGRRASRKAGTGLASASTARSPRSSTASSLPGGVLASVELSNGPSVRDVHDPMCRRIARYEVVERTDDDPWGRIVARPIQTPGFSQPVGFAGDLHDRVTGLGHLGAREYDPVTGRWMQKDPIRFAGGDTNFDVCFGDILRELALTPVHAWGRDQPSVLRADRHPTGATSLSNALWGIQAWWDGRR